MNFLILFRYLSYNCWIRSHCCGEGSCKCKCSECSNNFLELPTGAVKHSDSSRDKSNNKSSEPRACAVTASIKNTAKELDPSSAVQSSSSEDILTEQQKMPGADCDNNNIVSAPPPAATSMPSTTSAPLASAVTSESAPPPDAASMLMSGADCDNNSIVSAVTGVTTVNSANKSRSSHSANIEPCTSYQIVERISGQSSKPNDKDLQRDMEDDLAHRKFKYFDTFCGFAPFDRDKEIDERSTFKGEGYKCMAAKQYVFYWFINSTQFAVEKCNQTAYDYLLNQR